MAKLIAMYKKPADAKTFDAYYYSTHLAIAKKIPGLVGYEVSSGPIGTPAGESEYHLIATLSFDSMSALQSALASAESGAAAKDLTNFVTGGVDLLIFDTKEI